MAATGDVLLPLSWQILALMETNKRVLLPLSAGFTERTPETEQYSQQAGLQLRVSNTKQKEHDHWWGGIRVPEAFSAWQGHKPS